MSWDDVIGEPDSIRSPECAWRVSNQCFNITKNFCYTFLSVLFAPIAAFCLGFMFACLAFEVWCYGEAQPICCICIFSIFGVSRHVWEFGRFLALLPEFLWRLALLGWSFQLRKHWGGFGPKLKWGPKVYQKVQIERMTFWLYNSVIVALLNKTCLNQCGVGSMVEFSSRDCANFPRSLLRD